MKKLVLFFALTTMAFGTLYVIQGRKLAERQAQVSDLSGDLEQKSQRIETLERSQKLTDQQRRDLLRQTGELAAQIQARQAAETKTAQPGEVKASLLAETKATFPAPASPAATAETGKPVNDPGGFGKFLSKMMEDPNAKQFIRNQQRQSMDQLYNPLIQQMGLTPEEAAKFKDLMTDNVMRWTEKASPLYDGSSPANSAQLSSSIVADQENFDKELKGFLGEGRFAQYQAFQQTAAERAQLNMFRQQTFGRDNSITDQQNEQLLAFMKEEKDNLAAAGQSVFGDGQGQLTSDQMLSGDEFDKLLKSQESLTQRVYDRARTVLTPAQLDDFGKFQTNQLQTMRMGLGMARKLFAPDNTETTAPAGQ